MQTTETSASSINKHPLFIMAKGKLEASNWTWLPYTNFLMVTHPNSCLECKQVASYDINKNLDVH